MSTRVEQALQEYQDAVRRHKGAVASQGGNTREERATSSKGYQASRGGHSSSDDVMAKWENYLQVWGEEGTGEWFAPFTGGDNG